MKFSAVILAGGKSSRMGRDKALLEVDGQSLLARQIQLARDAGAEDVFISGRVDTDYAAFDCPVLRDRFTDTGPLAGIEAALDAATTPLLLVLAVDMPHMSVDLLRQLATHCTETVGAIPRVNGATEPLAAFYPKVCAGLVSELLDAHFPLTPALSPRERENPTPSLPKTSDWSCRIYVQKTEDSQLLSPLPKREGQGEVERRVRSRSAKRFAERCVAAGLAMFVDLPARNTKLFANWNSPADLPCLK